MRAALALCLLLLAGCTEPNPTYCGPRGFIDCVPTVYVYPDMTGFEVVPIRDMTVDQSTPPDLLPEYLAHVGEPCDGGVAEPIMCVNSKACVAVAGVCVSYLNCCANRDGQISSCYRGRCCSITDGYPCRTNDDCCYTKTDKPPVCVDGLCKSP
jgi:hypothetical protein